MDRLPFREAYDPLRALRSTWSLFKRSPARLGGAALLVVLVDPAWIPTYTLPFVSRSLLIVSAVLWLSHAMLQVVFARVVASAARGAELSSGEPLSDLVRAGSSLVTELIVSVFPIAGIVLSYRLGSFLSDSIPLDSAYSSGAFEELLVHALAFAGGCGSTLWVALGISLATRAVVFESLGPLAALRRSWSLVRGNRLRLLVYFAGLAIAVVLGLLAFVIGALPAGIAIAIAQNESYLRLVGEPRFTPRSRRTALRNAPAMP